MIVSLAWQNVRRSEPGSFCFDESAPTACPIRLLFTRRLLVPCRSSIFIVETFMKLVIFWRDPQLPLPLVSFLGAFGPTVIVLSVQHLVPARAMTEGNA